MLGAHVAGFFGPCSSGRLTKAVWTPRPLKLAAGVATTRVRAAVGMYLVYGSVSPCGVPHAKARSMITATAMKHFDSSSGGAAIGSSLAMLLVNAMPIDDIIDAALTKRLGGAGPLQCTLALIQTDWTDLDKRNNSP